MPGENAICILAKSPRPGEVKEQLECYLGREQAAVLARAFLLDTIASSLKVPRADVFVAYRPPESRSDFSDILFLFAKEERDKRIARKAEGITFIPQAGNDPGERLIDVSRMIFERGARRLLIVCSDNPLLDPAILRASLELLRKNHVVLGPTFDGGYYLVGTDGHYPALFQGIKWSSENVYRDTLQKLRSNGLEWQELELSYDVDRPEELQQLYCDIDNLRLAGENSLCYHTERCLANLKQ